MQAISIFDRLIDTAVAAQSDQSLRHALAAVAQAHGFERFAYLNLQTAKSFAVSTYPQEWQSIYFERSYQTLDPVVTAAKRMMRAFRWSTDFERRRSNDDTRRFYDCAAEFGIRSGLSIPIRGGFGQVVIFTLATHKIADAAISEEVDAVGAAAAAALIHARLHGTAEPTRRRDFTLSDREALCLRWAAEGMPMHFIATVTGLTYHTVRWDLDKIRQKLGVRTMKQAVNIATRFQLI
jgi:LuxR family transcriptional activator of conjugal transfer of Ti plasmids